ncbi:hypothetical protein FT663_04387 [Candidozyma haemuli var. vulneris]|uniref:Kinetochore protein Spc24 n=1 Tax=Candidozyma haemuli TaxID=45357 RepID=A0A2V1ATP0_9ASCO|nr:hypothetical protein CXQ85_000166 [[Candida] haemuloni]KAF3987570.1 hypothetical protein FT663_04387 [[Candida] haemuloni var. vulneris]KAF3988892.1 hypothetical protein FT662_03125 [[Candida] haemuloni var. vulneris]PVH21199.1 hypothetical protein CXQ85_000166 [[Candida] haemuloni]
MLGSQPQELIYSTIENFETEPDITSLSRISETIVKTEEKRNAKLDRLQKGITALEEQLAEAKSKLESLNQPSDAFKEQVSGLGKSPLDPNENTFQLINTKSGELDSMKVTLAKQLTDIESQINQLHMTKMNLTKQKDEFLQQKEQALAVSVAENHNSSSMKISLFRSLGVHVDSAEKSDKIVIFDEKKNQTSVLDVDEKYSDYFISNYIWERLGT